MDKIKRGPNNFNRNFQGRVYHSNIPIRKSLPQKTPFIQKSSSKNFENIKTEVTKPVEKSGEKQDEMELKPFRGYVPITRFSQEKTQRIGPNITMMVVAIIIVIFVILGIIFLFSKTELSQTGIESQNLDMKIKNVQIEENSIKLNLEIDPKEENLVGIKFIFDDESNFEVFKEDILITTLGEREFIFELKNIDPSKIKKILIAPIFEDQSKEKIIGSIKDTYTPNSNNLVNLQDYNPKDYSVDVNYTEEYGGWINSSYNNWTYNSTINQTNCSNYTFSNCYNGDVYWYNSCNILQEIKEDCNSTQYCFNATCINNQTNLTLCAKQGESFDFSNSSNPNLCCNGLKNVHTQDLISVADKCYPTGTVSGAPLLICSNCGNGICEDVESVCGCNIDCNGKNKSDYSTLSDFCANGLNRVSCSELSYFNENINLCKLCVGLINQTIQNKTTPICGNGILETGEYCDMNNLAGETCQSFGYKSGKLGCRKTCEFDTRYCSEYTGIIQEDIPKICTSYNYSQCYNGDVYWYNSCDERGTIKESCLSDETCLNGECINNAPVCNSNSYFQCYNNDVYWYNSCGVREIMRENCTSSQTCTNGACVTTTYSCSGSSTQACTLTNAVGTQTGTCNTATGQWVWGTCTISSCNSGYGNCDNNNANGCETTLGTNSHCASCTNVCSSTQTCTNRVCITSNSGTNSGYLLVDHNSAMDFDKIPDYWINEAKKLTLHYAHTSHGSQIISGANYVESHINSKYNIAVREATTEGLPTSDLTALRIYDGNPPETYIVPEDYWDGSSAITRTRGVASTGYYDYSMWSWCGQQSSNSVDTVNRYLTTMKNFESEFPNMRFILMTGHTDGSGLDNPSKTLTRNNKMIKDYAIANNMILFDFADIEAYDPAGNYYSSATDSCTWCTSWCNSHPSDCQNLPSCAHSHGRLCVQKGKAFWWMMARLAGWDGVSS